MKYPFIIISVLIAMSASASVSAADTWEEYSALRSRYYHLDEQEFNNITCTIESPMLTDVVRQLRAQFEPLRDNMEIVENISGFSLSYSSSSGLDITRPELDVVIKSQEGMADPDRVREGVQMIKSGFGQAIAGIVMQLEGVLEGYLSPRRQNYEMLEFAEEGEGPIVTYRRGGNDVTETFSGNKIEIESVGTGGEMHALESYEETAGNKLILKEASVTVEQPMGTIESDIHMTYQEVGPVIFPKRIATRFTQEVQSMRQEGQTEVNLNDCMAD
ncbi:MAG: hypothetical protein PVG55_00325 [Nitrospirota bacterium]|jgi:hypothetical protein